MSVSAALSFTDLPQPRPVAGEDAYAREKELALASDAAKRDNFELFKAHKVRTAEVDYLPIKLDIENVSRCNFRCPMCVVPDWQKGQRANDMSLNDFNRLLDEQTGLLEIKLQGIGEPLLQRDDFFAMIRAARARHIWVRTTTNASLLHLKNNMHELIDSDPNEIQISIDGATAETFEKIRVGGDFDQVTKNCKAINASCREKDVKRTKMWTVVQQDNVNELSMLVDLAAELGFESQVFSLTLSDWGLDHMNTRNNSVSAFDNLRPQKLMGLVDQGRALGVEVAFWMVREKYSTETPEKLCPWAFERAYVGSDNRVTPCCYIGNPDVYEIGNGIDPDNSFSSIWHGTDYKNFRRAHLDGKIPKVCQSCYEDKAT